MLSQFTTFAASVSLTAAAAKRRRALFSALLLFLASSTLSEAKKTAASSKHRHHSGNGTTASGVSAGGGSRVKVGGGYAFRRISREQNADIQRFCENEEFLDEESSTRIVHGDRAPPGKYPWAGALVALDGTLCGATIITPRHLLTARHCFENVSPELLHSLRLMVGGVCHTADADLIDDGGTGSADASDDEEAKCPHVDMREARVEFAGYAPRRFELNRDNQVHDKETDMAIIQLRHDLRFNLSKRAKDLNEGETQPACFPPIDDADEDLLPEVMHVYGWGMNEENQTESRLMEVEMPVADVERDPIFKHGFNSDYFRRICNSKRLFCMHSKNPKVERDGHVGDSGTGIIGKFRSQPMLYGATIAGDPTTHINIALRFSTLAFEICHYTGYCVKRAWAAQPDARSRTQRLAVTMRAFFDPRKSHKVVVD